MKSKTKISKQTERKNNSELVETVFLAKKNKGWLDVAAKLSTPTRNRIEINLEKLNDFKEGEKIVVPGKILSVGEVSKKLNVIALKFSARAKEKLLNSKCEVSSILEEIKKNPEGKGIKILK